jgi:hypothetical protein
LFEVAAALDLDLQSGVWGPELPLRDVYGLDPALSGWRPLLVGLLDDFSDEWSEESSESVATIGHIPDSISAQQVSLDQIESMESETVPSDTGGSEISLQ